MRLGVFAATAAAIDVCARRSATLLIADAKCERLARRKSSVAA